MLLYLGIVAYESKYCGTKNEVKYTKDFYRVEVTGLTRGSFCVVYDPQPIDGAREGRSYYVTAQLSSLVDWGRMEGVMYNVKDLENYDFAFIR